MAAAASIRRTGNLRLFAGEGDGQRERRPTAASLSHSYLGAELRAHDRLELVDRPLERVVDDHVLELLLGVELELGGAQALGDRLRIVGPAALEPQVVL